MSKKLIVRFNHRSLNSLLTGSLAACMMVLMSSCSSSKDLVSNNPIPSNADTSDTFLVQNTGENAINLNNIMITDVDVLEYYNKQAQTVFELYVEAQYQFRNMRFYNALSLLDRSIAIVPTIQAYLLQVVIYHRIGESDKAIQVYAQAEELNNAMGEDLIQPIELLTGVTARNNND